MMSSFSFKEFLLYTGSCVAENQLLTLDSQELFVYSVNYLSLLICVT